jgi:hypothetical protein
MERKGEREREHSKVENLSQEEWDVGKMFVEY